MHNEQVMVDLETLDITPTAVICSIGAVRFGIKDGEYIGLGAYYQAIMLEDQTDRTTNKDTLMWWAKQSDEARKCLYEKDIDLETGLRGFMAFAGDCPVWGNGSDFDNAILANACKKFGIKWDYKRNRDYRTLKSLCPTVVLKREGTYHNAYDDALSQTKHLVAILNALNIKL
jgi:hypothetical protein